MNINNSIENPSKWFAAGAWKEGWAVSADHSIDAVRFARAYERCPQRWEMAFRFFAETDLKSLSVGRHVIDGDNVFVNISEYDAKNFSETHYEVHRKYADIQYVIEGIEQIGVVPLQQTYGYTRYDAEKDVFFAESDSDTHRLATPVRFFIFLPNEAHRPAIRFGDYTAVKKAVAKILLYND